MHRRRVLCALASATASLSGCVSSEQSSREPYGVSEETVTANESSEEVDEFLTPAFRAEVSITSRYENAPCPPVESERVVCYHDLGSSPSGYLAPVTEWVPETAEEHTFLVFNRTDVDVDLEVDRLSLFRWIDGGWTSVSVSPDVDEPDQSVSSIVREPATVDLSFEWIEDGPPLSSGTYALAVPAQFDDADAETHHLAALFAVGPESALVRAGEQTGSIRIDNDPQVTTQRAAVDAELLRTETTAHPALLRVRLRCFTTIGVDSAPPYHRSVATAEEDPSTRLEVSDDARYRDGCWVTPTDREELNLPPSKHRHGSEMSYDLVLGTPDDDACASAGRYRFDDVFGVRPAIESWFSVRYSEV